MLAFDSVCFAEKVWAAASPANDVVASGRVKTRVAPAVNPAIWNRACLLGSMSSCRVKAASLKTPVIRLTQMPVPAL